MSDSKVPPIGAAPKLRGRQAKKAAKEEGPAKKTRRSPRRKGKEGKGEEKATKIRRAKSADGTRGGSKSPLAPRLQEASAIPQLRRTSNTAELVVPRPRQAQESPLHCYRRILSQLSHITVQGSTEAMHQATAALLPDSYREENANRILLTEKEEKHLRKIVAVCQKLFAHQEELQAPMLLQRATRTFLARRRLASTRANLHPAARAFHRFIKEQLRYLDSLAILVDHFFAPLRNTSDPEIRARAADIHAVFCNIDELEAAALTLVRRLRKSSDLTWPHLRGMGAVFIELAPELAVYDRYAENHVFARECLNDLMATCDSFRFMVEQTSARLKVSLPELLLLPLEHLSSFPAILRKFGARERSEEERQMILNASAVMDTRLASVNAARAKSNKTFFVSQVQRTLIPSKKPYTRHDEILATQDLRKEGRVFKSELSVDMKVKKGAITKKVPVKLLAFNDVCLLVRPREGDGREEKNELLDVFNLEITVITQHPSGFSLREVDEEQATPSSPTLERAADKKGLAKERRFACDSDGGASRVVTAMQSLIDQCQHRVFGIDLELLLEREENQSGVPAVLKLCGDFLRERVDEEGILRIPGSKAEEGVLVQMLNKSTDVDLSKTNATVHDVGTVFKHYLSDLPQPLISQEGREKMVQEQQKYELERSKSKFVRALRSILRPSRKAELSTLRYVSELMYDLAHLEKGKDNKMTCENLATCVGPDVMQPEAENMAQVLLIPIANNALGFVFENHAAVFKDL